MSNQPSLGLEVIIELLNQKGISTETEEGERLPFLIDAENVGVALGAVILDTEGLGATLGGVVLDNDALGEAVGYLVIQSSEDQKRITELETKLADLEAKIGGETNE
ncbi:hypothetical protein NSQ54_10340 [Alkalihalobacillus sp. FSL W8-0930]